MENKKHFSFTIDSTKIPQEKIVKKDKEGKPFKNNNEFVNCIAFINEEPDQYGNIINIALQGDKSEKTIYIGGQKAKK